jgi:hypothetical protein
MAVPCPSYGLPVDTNAPVDALCQGRKVGIKRTDRDTSVRWPGVMQPKEMPPIEGHHDPLLSTGKHQNVRIGYRLPRPATFGGRKDIVAQVS